MIPSILAGYFLKCKGPFPFKIKYLSVLINFRVAFLGNVAYAYKLCYSVAPQALYSNRVVPLALYSDPVAPQDVITVIAVVALH
jgi:hypothetical protein